MSTAQIFLRHEYTTGPESGSFELIGPFPSASAASAHRDEHGPVAAEIGHVAPSVLAEAPVMSADAHMEYLRRRY